MEIKIIAPIKDNQKLILFKNTINQIKNTITPL